MQIHLLGKFHNFFYPLGTLLLLLSMQVYEAIALLFYPPFPLLLINVSYSLTPFCVDVIYLECPLMAASVTLSQPRSLCALAFDFSTVRQALSSRTPWSAHPVSKVVYDQLITYLWKKKIKIFSFC